MAQLFPRWTNKTPLVILGTLLGGVALVILLLWYYGSPQYTDVGYMPEQPIFYSHKLHVGELGMDCRYCHSAVEVAAHANIPPTKTCMNCHGVVGQDSDKILPVRESWALAKPIEWIRVHKAPDYAYFNHAAHLRAGVGCVSCHGAVDQMVIVQQVQSLSMGWCLDCHRHPDAHLRPTEKVTDMSWTVPADHAAFVANWKREKQLNPPVDCSGCHR